MLMPKRVKYRKQQRGRMRGKGSAVGRFGFVSSRINLILIARLKPVWVKVKGMLNIGSQL